MKTPVAIERDTLSGLYAYLFGTIGGSLFTSSTFMAVQATGAMAIIIADVPAVHSASDVVVLQPYGSLFFAAAPAFESQLPAVASTSGNSVVIVRLRGRTDLGTTFMQVLSRYGAALADVGSKLVLVSVSKQVQEQLRAAGVTEVIGARDIYVGHERVGAALKRAYADAAAWIEARES